MTDRMSVSGMSSRTRHEPDICRVCRMEGTPEQPLFYPCLCAGSIKYIHQDCLVEWLKHSKKKYCELCKHAFSFTPVYGEDMPQKLPISVFVKGLAKRIGSGALVGLRYLAAGIAWCYCLPYLVVQPFRLYFGWKFAEHVKLLIDPCIGILLIMFICLCFGGLYMLKDYMETNGLFGFIDEVPQKNRMIGAYEDSEDEEEDERPDKEKIEPGSWLEQVTPREYRAFLRRRDYYREKNDVLRVKHHESRAQKNAEILRMIEAGIGEAESVAGTSVHSMDKWETATDDGYSGIGEDDGGKAPIQNHNLEYDDRTTFVGSQTADSFNPYMLDDHTIGSMTSFGDFTDASGGISAPPKRYHSGIAGSAGVVFREEFRCKICQKRSCIKKEHVVMASMQARAAHNRPADNQNDNRNGQDARQANPAVQPNNMNDNRPLALLDWLLELDDGVDHHDPANNNGNGAEELGDMMGITGSPLTALKYFLIILIGLQLLSHILLILPLAMGMLVVDGTLPIGLAWIKTLAKLAWNWARPILFAGKSSSTEPPLTVYVDLAREALVRLSTAIVSCWDKGIDLIQCYWNVLEEWRPSTVKAFLVQIHPLLMPRKTPFNLVIFRLISGYTCSVALNATIFFTCLSSAPRPLNPALRQCMALLYLQGAFLKFVAIHWCILILFPLWAGICLDYWTMPLFKTTLLERIQFYADETLGSIVLHYLPGLVFTFILAYAVSSIRKMSRPGLLFFIRNPEDPEEKYAKDVLDRPIHKQIFGLIPTFIFYCGIISVMIGGVVPIIIRLFPSIVPLKIGYDDAPSSSIPYEFVIQGVGKLILDAINPYVCTQALPTFIRAVLRNLSLSSYFLGGRYLPEESFPKGGRWTFVPDFDRVYTREKLLSIAKKDPQPLDVAKIPIKETRKLANGQSAAPPLPDFSQFPQPRRPGLRRPSRKSADVSKGFTVVFKPNWFKLRCLGLFSSIFAYWTGSAILLFVMPLLTGRFIGNLIIPGYEFRDTHTFIAGFIVFGMVIRASVDTVKGLYAADPEQLHRVFVRAPWTAIKVTIVTTFMLVLWPLLFGLYGFLCLSPIWVVNPQTNDRIPKLAEVWSIGLILVKGVVDLSLYIAPRYYLAFAKLKIDGLGNIDLNFTLRHLLLPMTLKIILSLVEPPLYVFSAFLLFSLNPDNLLYYQSWAYTISLLRPLTYVIIGMINEHRTNIAARIRDDNYLVGRRLHNLERAQPPSVSSRPTGHSPILASSPAKLAGPAPISSSVSESRAPMIPAVPPYDAPASTRPAHSVDGNRSAATSTRLRHTIPRQDNN